MDTHVVIMAGGVGSRFWPMSREHKPKQFLDILGTGESLMHQTYSRFENHCSREHFLVVTSEQYVSLTAEHLPKLSASQILAEPSRKNTAPCIGFAAYKIAKTNPDALMVVTPADHLITKQNDFDEALQLACEHAADTGNLVTMGIKPTRPDTGYGYIQFHSEDANGRAGVHRVKNFTEKPDADLALQFLKSGDFYWNSGMFIWKVSSIIDAFEKHLPSLANLFEKEAAALNTETERFAIERIYSVCESISIDYGVMEKAPNVDVVLGDFGWSDLGTWGSLYDQLPKDENANASLSEHLKLYESDHNMIRISDGKVALIQGLSGYIVVDTPDALLICQKDEEQKIKQYVADIKSSDGNQFL